MIGHITGQQGLHLQAAHHDTGHTETHKSVVGFVRIQLVMLSWLIDYPL